MIRRRQTTSAQNSNAIAPRLQRTGRPVDKGCLMRKLTRVRTVSAALLASSAIVSPAFAEAPAPRFVNIDKNGVDLTTGKVQFGFEEGGIGAGEGAVRFQRIFAQDAGWVDNYSGGMFDATVNGIAKTYVQIAGVSDVFTKSGTTYTSDSAAGSTLALDSGSGNYIYIAADGTKILFGGFGYYAEYSYSCPGADPKSCHVPLSITKPNGLKVNFSWETASVCYDLPNEPCSYEKSYRRLSGISTSAGYSASIAYASTAIGSSSMLNRDWFNRTTISFTNSAGAPSPLPTITYAYPSTGVITVIDPGGRQWRLTTDGSGRLTGVRRPGSTSDNITYAYGTDGTISSATKDGVTTTYARIVSGSTATETTTDAGSGHTVTVSDLSKGRPTSFKDELNRTTAYEYDANARMIKVTQPEGNSITYAYDERGNVKKTTKTAKPSSGLSDIITYASFDETCTNIITCNKPQTTTDAKGNVTNYSYDPAHGGITAVTRPAPTNGANRPETRYSYTSVTSASGNPVYVLAGVSACQSGSAPSCLGTSDETKATIAWNNNLLPETVTRASGDNSLSVATATAYDARGRITSSDGPLGDTTSYVWDGSDQLTQIITPDPDGNGGLKKRSIRVTYRPDGQIGKQELGTVDSGGTFVAAQTVAIAFDSNSRPVTSKLSAGGADFALTQTSYDALGRTDCTTTRMNIAAYGSLPGACTLGTQGSDGPDRISKFIYDAAGQVTQVKEGVGTSAEAATRTMTYSGNGAVASLTDGENNTTTYTYDGFDRLIKTTYPNTIKGSGTSNGDDYEQLSYDANSNVISRRLRDGNSISFTFDNLNRATLKDLPGIEPDVTYGYDNLGRVTSATQTGNALSLTWDALGRRVTEAGTQGTVTSAYDLAGRRTQITYPGSGLSVNYDYLVTGEVSAIRENGATSGVGVLASYGYDDLGNRTSSTFGNGASQTYVYDPVSRLKTLTNELSGTNNNLTIGGSTTPLTYNSASQITSAPRTSANSGYSFTDYLNVSRGYTANGLNQYARVGAANFTYDAKGNLTYDELTHSEPNSFCYSSENLLIGSGTSCAAPSVTLAYDPAMRLSSITGTATTRFAYDGLNMIAEYGSSNALQRRYVFAPGLDQPIVWYEGATIDNSTRRFMSADERGSIISVTDSNGGLIGVNAYDEYGIPGSSNVANQRFGYTGQAWLPELGMAYYKARIYSPTLGRFLQTDPIGYDDGPNWYAYVGNDPVNSRDPLGLSCDSAEPADTEVGDCEIVVTGSRINKREDEIVVNGRYSFPGFDFSVVINLPTLNFTGGVTQKQPENEQSMACTFLPLSKSDEATVHGILNDTDVQLAMDRSWSDTLKTRNENSFFIYRDSNGYRAGPNVPGGPSSTGPRLWYQFIIRDENPVANFHTHPGTWRSSGQPSVSDSNFAQKTGTISLIKTRFGLISGRRCP
jgi:RHS repeat-associated protein